MEEIEVKSLPILSSRGTDHGIYNHSKKPSLDPAIESRGDRKEGKIWKRLK